MPADASDGAPASRRRWQKRLFKRLSGVAPIVLSGVVWVLSWTLRPRLLNADDLYARWARGERVILAFWHERLVLMPVAAGGHRICIMNSAHRDGEIGSRALARWGIQSVRGSATRGGATGFLRLVRAYRDGYNLAVIPDGPRGPGGIAKPGVIHLARATGALIVPVTYAARHVRRLRSWDRMLIPLPFSRVVLAAGEPLRVPRDATPGEIEHHRRTLEQRLNDLTRAAEDAVVA